VCAAGRPRVGRPPSYAAATLRPNEKNWNNYGTRRVDRLSEALGSARNGALNMDRLLLTVLLVATLGPSLQQPMPVVEATDQLMSPLAGTTPGPSLPQGNRNSSDHTQSSKQIPVDFQARRVFLWRLNFTNAIDK